MLNVDDEKPAACSLYTLRTLQRFAFREHDDAPLAALTADTVRDPTGAVCSERKSNSSY